MHGSAFLTRACILLTLCGAALASAGEPEDLAGARAVFEANLGAIQNEDAEAYLACYWPNESFTRNGPGGPSTGYAEWAAGVGGGWPEVFDAEGLRLQWLRPGLVYGSYRYRVSFGGQESTGISERVFLDTPDGWRIAVSTAFPDPEGAPPPPLALVGGTVVDPIHGRMEHATVILRGGVIDTVGPAADIPVPDGIETMDVSGRFLAPGLIDAHVHFSQTGWVDARPDAVDLRETHPYAHVVRDLRDHPERWYPAYLGSGVTSVFDVGGYPWTVALAAESESNTRSPRILASGPLLATVDHWVNLPGERQFLFLDSVETALEQVRYIHSLGSRSVKVWFLAVDDDLYPAMEERVTRAATEAKGLGMRVLVHATTLREAKAALRAGADLLVHGVSDQPVDDEFLNLLRASGAVYCPTLIVPEGYLKVAEAAVRGHAVEVDDPHQVLDSLYVDTVLRTPELTAGKLSPTRLESLRRRVEDRRGVNQANLNAVAAAGLPIALGTDAGNPLTLHGTSVFAELEAMHAAGLSHRDVFRAATLGGAAALDRDDLGRIHPGAAADLLLLDGDPSLDVSHYRRLLAVIRGGEHRPIEEFRRR